VEFLDKPGGRLENVAKPFSMTAVWACKRMIFPGQSCGGSGWENLRKRNCLAPAGLELVPGLAFR